MAEGSLHLYSQQAVLRILIARDDQLTGTAIQSGPKILAALQGTEEQPLLQHVARSFRRQYVEHTLIADLSGLPYKQLVEWLRDLDLTIRTERETLRGKIRLEPGRPADLAGLPTAALRRLLTTRPHLAKVLQLESSTQLASDDSVHPLNIEFSAASGGLLFVQGWCANASSIGLELYSAGLSTSTQGRMAFGPRPDVSGYLREQGHEIDDDMHGFVATLPIPFASRLRGYGSTRQGLRVVYDDALKLTNTPSDAIERLVSLWRSGVFTWEQTTANLLPFLQPMAPMSEAFQTCLTASVDQPRVSVIVPFYREWRFAFSVAQMIEKSPSDWEWVLVCDDNGIHPTLLQFLREQPHHVRKRITYLRTLSNMGYGLSNNIGVSLASSSRVLLMNSDIWLDDCGVVDREVEAMHPNERRVVGFRLLFEDHTLQHDGLEFQESAELGGRMICVHPKKGVPEALLRGSATDRDSVKAVTGALMLMPKALFQELGGFSSTYIGGDFEDADLCLQVTASGGIVELVRTPGLYHLERQSIRHDSAGGISFARTLVNCEQFNQRWYAHRLAHNQVQG
jgi:GT2 family glycosyltransferase